MLTFPAKAALGRRVSRTERANTMAKVQAAERQADFSVSHLRDAAFESDGLRAFFEYRDLGIKAATGGRVGAQVIRAKPGGHGGTGWHRHALEVQLVYTKGP
jgi:hypothetical protein